MPILKRLNLSGQFLLFSLIVLLAGMASIGLWIQREIKEAVTHRTAEVTALYVNSFVSPQLQSLGENTPLTAGAVEAFDRLLTGTALGADIVAFRIWASDGTVLYSPNEALIGQTFEAHSELALAFAGGLVSEVSDLSKPENVYERQLWDSLIETYAPVRLEGSDEVAAVAEFYQRPDALLADIRRAQVRSWLFVGTATLIMYLLLVGIVHRVSNIIESQRDELEGNVTRLRGLLVQNRNLQERMQAAAERTTALNEQYLHRISADLHDGPAQDVALALLRMEGLDAALRDDHKAGRESDGREDLNTVRSSLDSALADLRSIARGLRLPEIEDLTPTDTALRVLRDFQRATGTEVEFRHEDVPKEAPLPVKITIYRVLQEALANSFKHANGASQTVTMTSNGTDLSLEVTDDGPGFDPQTRLEDGSLGLTGMRERVEMLGGRFDVAATAPSGTRVQIRLPLVPRKVEID
jgi:signal transduction histidine kinase